MMLGNSQDFRFYDQNMRDIPAPPIEPTSLVSAIKTDALNVNPLPSESTILGVAAMVSGAHAVRVEPANDIEDSRPSQRPHLFGRADLAAVYRQARDLIVQQAIFRMVQVTQDSDGGKQVTICNLWRIVRSADGQVQTFEYRFNLQQWVAVTEIYHWPAIPLLPVKTTRSLDWWRTVANQAIWKTLFGAGYATLPVHLQRIEFDAMGQALPGSRGTMAYILIRRYTGKNVGTYRRGMNKGSPKWTDGFLKPKLMIAGARALRAAIFEHILETEVVSVALAIDYQGLTLEQYLKANVFKVQGKNEG